MKQAQRAARLLDWDAVMRFPSSRAPKTDPDANFATIQSAGFRRRVAPDPVCDRFLRLARLRHRDSVSADVRRAPGYRRRRDRTPALGLLDYTVHLRAAARAAFRSNWPAPDHHAWSLGLVAELSDLWIHGFVCGTVDLARSSRRMRGDDIDRASLHRRHHRGIKARAGDGNDRCGLRLGLRAGAGGRWPA